MKIFLFIISLIAVFSFNHLSAQDIQIYQVNLYSNNTKGLVGFTSLSQNYHISTHPDSLAIPDISGLESEDLMFITLRDNFRNTFLHKLKIAETDTLFIFDYVTGNIIKHEVKSLKVIAVESIYNVNALGFRESPSFHIGFELDVTPMRHIQIHHSVPFVYVGKENPFAKGQIKPIIWKPCSSFKYLGNNIKHYNDSLLSKHGINDSLRGKCYEFSAFGHHYFTQEIGNTKSEITGRSYIIKNDISQEIIYCKAYFKGDSSSPSDIIVNGIRKDEFSFQYTGILFKDKGPVIIGLEFTYDCNKIEFLSPKEKTIIIKCDSRY